MTLGLWHTGGHEQTKLHNEIPQETMTQLSLLIRELINS